MLTLRLNNLDVDLYPQRFPDSCVGYRINGVIPRQIESAQITAKLSPNVSASELAFGIASVVDLVRSINSSASIILFLPFIPYSRQDRRMVKHDAFSLKVFANWINSLQLSSVLVLDPHSDVGPALINNCVVLEQSQIVLTNPIKYDLSTHGYVLVSPDMGAVKKSNKVAKALGMPPPVVMDKDRNPSTGEVTGIKVLGSPNLEDENILIVDDICDGGATFISAATELKVQYGVNSVSVFVTHGIFSRGVENLLNNGIDKVYSTDSVITVQDPTQVSTDRYTRYLSSGIVAAHFRSFN